jgi:phosphatidylserine/phosphatidylglycerophosphate/cardiolipin synthase-like enzyme
MAKFLTTRGTTSEIEQIINNARKSIVLISPFIRVPDSLFQNLMTADKRGVTTTLIYGKSDLQREVLEQLRQLINLKIYFLDNLHAKCYFNEQSMVITSLNLYDFSEQNNREMGVLLTRQDDLEAYEEAVREAKRIVALAKLQDSRQKTGKRPLTKEAAYTGSSSRETKDKLDTNLLRGFSDIILDAVGLGRGHCIGCKARIDYDEYRPYCLDCYKQWIKSKTHKANYCHACGVATMTTIEKPLCHPCFEKSLE